MSVYPLHFDYDVGQIFYAPFEEGIAYLLCTCWLVSMLVSHNCQLGTLIKYRCANDPYYTVGQGLFGLNCRQAVYKCHRHILFISAIPPVICFVLYWKDMYINTHGKCHNTTRIFEYFDFLDLLIG